MPEAFARERSLALVHCGQLVTLAGPARPRIRDELKQLAIVRDGSMLVRDGYIERIGSHLEIQPHITSDYDILDAGGRVVVPGFVDAHTHPVFAGDRVDEYEKRAAGSSYAEIAAAGGGIRSTVAKTRAASEDDLFAAAHRRLAWFLRTGTTSLEAKSGYGLDLETELKMLRVLRRLDEEGPLEIVPTFLGAHEIPDEFRSDPEGYLDLLINEMLPAVVEQKLARYCDAFCEPNIFPTAAVRRLFSAARPLGLGLRLHADQLSSSGASRLAAELKTDTADHLEQIVLEGIQALAQAGVQPVLLPASVYALGSSRYPPARALIEAGLGIVLATDFNPGSSPIPSIPFVLSIASTQMHMTPAEAITSVTINAACSVALGDRKGSLEPGKHADFAIHDAKDYREIAYYAGIESAAAVFIRGRRVFARFPQYEEVASA